jgi:hypothetical protein
VIRLYHFFYFLKKFAQIGTIYGITNVFQSYSFLDETFSYEIVKERGFIMSPPAVAL